MAVGVNACGFMLCARGGLGRFSEVVGNIVPFDYRRSDDNCFIRIDKFQYFLGMVVDIVDRSGGFEPFV